jgi:VIT1/CCC1 family predicted Fe2+/Mn2+ transporter
MLTTLCHDRTFAHVKRMPEKEKEEMALIYQAKGLDESQARALADRLMANKETAIDTLVREELGIDPAELGGSPWTAAASSFCLFAAGAIFPVTPFFWLGGTPALLASLALSGLALVLIGAGTSLFTARGFPLSASRQLLIGYAAAAITYGVGRLVGVTIGG